MTPNDALTQLERSHRHSYNSNPISPSLRRRLTRSPSPAISLESKPSRRTRKSSYSSESDSSSGPMLKRRPLPKRLSNGHTNGISHVPEETTLEEVIPTDPPSKTKRRKVDWEIPRKTLHASVGFLSLHLYSSSFSATPVIRILCASLIVISSAEILRFRSSRFETAYERCVGFLMRDSEKRKTNGVIWYLCGVLFVLFMYPLDIAVVSVLILSWADTAASTFGRLYGPSTPKLPSGHIPIPLPFIAPSRWPRIQFASRKSTAGFIASATTTFLITTSFWGYFAWFRQSPPAIGWRCVSSSVSSGFFPLTKWGGLIAVGLVNGVLSGIAEALDLGSVDDNLALPIISGAALWATMRLIC